MSQDILHSLLLYYPLLLFSLSVHEAAHAYSAEWGGDSLPRAEGRTTINPLAHIDPIGTVLFPLIGIFTGAPLLGWAKPVQTNPHAFRRGERYGLIVAMAGPFSNLVLAMGFAGLLSILLVVMAAMPGGMPEKASGVLMGFLFMGIFVNLGLFIFNLLPIPPLDGHYALWHLFIEKTPSLWGAFEVYRMAGPFLLWGLVLTGGVAFLAIPISALASVLYGLADLPTYLLY